MSSYIELPLETDPEILAQEAFDFLQSRIPGWVPNDANLETILVEAIARMTAEARDVASAVPVEIFREFGELVNVLPLDATHATGTTTWTMIDNAGYTIEAGTQVGLRVAGDILIPFEVTLTTVIPPGSTVASNVPIRAVDPGVDASGLGGTGTTVELVDVLDYISNIVLNAATTGGREAETDDEYLSRLRFRLQLLAPRPIVPRDFAIMAQDIAEVDRAVAVDGYNPADQTYNNERMVSVAVVDSTGQPLSAPAKASVDDYLQSLREVNFIVHVIDPTYTTIDVNFTAVAKPGFTPSDVETRAEAAIATYLSPANWGIPEEVSGDVVITPEWENKTVVRYLELAQILNDVGGLDYVTALLFRTGANAFAQTDITMTGPVTLPQAGAINGTVTAP